MAKGLLVIDFKLCFCSEFIDINNNALITTECVRRNCWHLSNALLAECENMCLRAVKDTKSSPKIDFQYDDISDRDDDNYMVSEQVFKRQVSHIDACIQSKCSGQTNYGQCIYRHCVDSSILMKRSRDDNTRMYISYKCSIYKPYSATYLNCVATHCKVYFGKR